MSDFPLRASSLQAGKLLRAGCWGLALSAGAVGTAAQRTNQAQEATPAIRLVSAEQGRKIAAAALTQDEPVRGTQDCSHLVHQIYWLAGYQYSYASSFDLYAGHGNFRRVRHAQAGDLVTWPGHVGIVLNAGQHSFYSLVRSGLQAEDYFSPYWRSRGKPRFYRYVVEGRSEREAAEAERPAPPSSKSVSRRDSGAIAEQHAAAEKADTKHITANRATEEVSMRSKVSGAPLAPADSALANSAAVNLAAANPSVGEDMPATILITPEQRRPTAAETLQGISELSNTAANALRANEPLSPKTPTVIFDDLRVEKIETKRDGGWAQLQIDSHVQLTSDGADYKRRRDKVRFELRRDASGWVAIAPGERNYIARDAAVRVLAAQLAEMTQSEAAAQHDQTVIGQEARIANLLSALLEK